MQGEVPRKKVVLIVDDEKNIRFTVEHALRSDHLEVDSASSGVEGLRKFRERSYDLLLVDLRMPGMTGLEMLREIRRMAPEVPPAVIITAYGVPEQLLEAASLGAIDCVRKPFSIQTIRSLVGEIFERLEITSESAGTPAYYLRLGKRELMLGRCPEASELLRKAVAEEPRNIEAHILLGICAVLDDAGNDEATKHFRAALLIDPASKTAADYLAWLGRN